MPIGSHFIQAFRVASRGLAAQRASLGAATENLANAGVSAKADGQTYRQKRTVQSVQPSMESRFSRMLSRFSGVARTTDQGHLPTPALPQAANNFFEAGPTTEIVESDSERIEFDPSHPDADADGYVRYPDINVVDEMATIVSANRLYEANLASVQAARELIKRTIDI